MTKNAISRLRDSEKQTPVGREILSRMLDGDDGLTVVAPAVQYHFADDDQRPDDAD